VSVPFRDEPVPLTGVSTLPYTGWGASLQTSPLSTTTTALTSAQCCQTNGIDLLTANFIAAFKLVLSTGGQTMEFAFSDGASTKGRIHSLICVLWVTDESATFAHRSHEYNTVMFQNEQKLAMLASDVPQQARLYANDYLDISDPCSLIMTSYKIITSILKTGIITLTLNVLGSTPQTTSGIT
jgi:hypothetical protein